jgi:hypothetical protein
MYVYSSLYVGDFFLFFPTATFTNPFKVLFREQDSEKKNGKKEVVWRERVNLAPTILSRKWIDYKFRDRFIPSVKYDNVLPCELSYALLNPVSSPAVVGIQTSDKSYRNVELQILGADGVSVSKMPIDILTTKKKISREMTVKKPGLYKLALFDGTNRFEKSHIFFCNQRDLLALSEHGASDVQGRDLRMYCGHCACTVFPMTSKLIPKFIYKNYVPFKKYVDLGGNGDEAVERSIMRLKHPIVFRRGLVHLLNIIRLASIEDELTIVTSLFKENPSFAYFVTDKPFMFNMIPLMEDRLLQNILSGVEDDLISLGLKGEDPDIGEKLLKNLSSRRRRFILSLLRGDKSERDRKNAQGEISRRIKLYYEERIGRVLKIPSGDRLLFFPRKLDEGGTVTQRGLPQRGNYLCHSGDFILYRSKDLYRCTLYQQSDNCLRFDVEYMKDPIFTIAGVSESTLYLRCESSIRIALIHLYHWFTGFEDFELLEYIPAATVLSLELPAPALILTIGSIDSDGKPMEQVIRLKVKENG